MSDARVELTATYACDLCGAEAGRVELRPDGARIAVTVTGMVGAMHVWLTPADAPHAVAILFGAVRELYDYDNEWASFYCPQCARVYCRKHWRTEIQFEDDGIPGWYDCTYGTCPQGHRRILDD